MAGSFSHFLKTAKGRILIAILLGLALYIPAKWSLMHAQSEADIAIGSKNFTESRILAELYALTLEKAGYRIRRRFDLGGTLIAHASLQRHEIDLYPEYTGTGLISILKVSPPNDEKEAFKILSAAYQKRWRLQWLIPAEANDSQGLVVTKQLADKHNLYDISRLALLAPKLRLATIPEFEDREDGLKGLKKAYGPFPFKEVRQYDNSLKYRVLLSGNADIAVGFTTDGDLADSRFVLLKDDRHFWPPYRVAPVAQVSALKKFPAMEGALNQLSSILDTNTLRHLNAEVDLEKKDYRSVARTFFERNMGAAHTTASKKRKI